MDCLILLADAHAAGLTVTVDGDKLRITGPDTPQAAAAVGRLAEHKADIIRVMRQWQRLGELLTGPCFSEDVAECKRLAERFGVKLTWERLHLGDPASTKFGTVEAVTP